jgi:hypothetical protein
MVAAGRGMAGVYQIASSLVRIDAATKDVVIDLGEIAA